MKETSNGPCEEELYNPYVAINSTSFALKFISVHDC
jgi:hypothetical protein